MRAFAAVPVAIDPVHRGSGVRQRGDPRRRLPGRRSAAGSGAGRCSEWKAAYAAEINAEYLIGIGDAQARLGNDAEAKQSYQAYLADPLALPSSVEKVKAKLARLDVPSGALALPGPGLMLPGATAPPPAREVEAPLPLPGLDAAEPLRSGPPSRRRWPRRHCLCPVSLPLPRSGSRRRSRPPRLRRFR